MITSTSFTAFLQKAVNEVDAPYIVLDEGSHAKRGIRASFQFIYSLLNNNALYVVEDMHTCLGKYGRGFRKKVIVATDSHVEQVLRFLVVWRKSSFKSRTRQCEEFVEHLLLFRQTTRFQEKRTYSYLVESFEYYLLKEGHASFRWTRALLWREVGTLLALSLKLYTFIIKKQSWQFSAVIPSEKSSV